MAKAFSGRRSPAVLMRDPGVVTFGRDPVRLVFDARSGPRQLTGLAEMPGVELVVVDDRTETSRFTRELRWNQAFHRPAQGF